MAARFLLSLSLISLKFSQYIIPSALNLHQDIQELFYFYCYLTLLSYFHDVNGSTQCERMWEVGVIEMKETSQDLLQPSSTYYI